MSSTNNKGEKMFPPEPASKGWNSFYVCAFENVQNADALTTAMREQRLDAALVDARYVMSELHLLVAMNRALASFHNSSMKTKSVHAEFVFHLSPTRSIADSLATIGITPQSRCILLGVFNPSDVSQVASVASQIEGKEIVPIVIGQHCDAAVIAQLLKVPPSTALSSLEQQIVSRIATKDIQ